MRQVKLGTPPAGSSLAPQFKLKTHQKILIVCLTVEDKHRPWQKKTPSRVWQKGV